MLLREVISFNALESCDRTVIIASGGRVDLPFAEFLKAYGLQGDHYEIDTCAAGGSRDAA